MSDTQVGERILPLPLVQLEADMLVCTLNYALSAALHVKLAQAQQLSAMQASLKEASSYYTSKTDASSFSNEQCQRLDQVFLVFAQGAGDAIATLQSAVQQGAEAAAAEKAVASPSAVQHYQGMCACLLVRLQLLSEQAKTMQARRAAALASNLPGALGSILGTAQSLVSSARRNEFTRAPSPPVPPSGTAASSTAPGAAHPPPASRTGGFTRRAVDFVDKLSGQDGTQHVFSAVKGAVGTLGGVLGGLRPDAVAQRDMQRTELEASRSTVRTPQDTASGVSTESTDTDQGDTGGTGGVPKSVEHSTSQSDPALTAESSVGCNAPAAMARDSTLLNGEQAASATGGGGGSQVQAQLPAAQERQSASAAAEAEAILHRMQEVSSLVALFATKVQEQSETIDEVVTHTEQATVDVEEGGKQLHEALQGEGAFRWAVFWLLVAAGVLLLAMDYFS